MRYVAEDVKAVPMMCVCGGGGGGSNTVFNDAQHGMRYSVASYVAEIQRSARS